LNTGAVVGAAVGAWRSAETADLFAVTKDLDGLTAEQPIGEKHDDTGIMRTRIDMGNLAQL
jgi:hypothetical protein